MQGISVTRSIYPVLAIPWMSWCIKTCWVTGHIYFWILQKSAHCGRLLWAWGSLQNVGKRWLVTYGSLRKGGSGCVLCCTPEPLCFFTLVGGPIFLITMLWDKLGRFDTNETLEVGLEPLTYMTELIKWWRTLSLQCWPEHMKLRSWSKNGAQKHCWP